MTRSSQHLLIGLWPIRSFILLALFLGVIHLSHAQLWYPLGSGLNYDGYTLDVDTVQDKLYVGGCFMKAGGLDSYGVAEWNGNSWTALGNQDTDNGCANTICSYSGEVFIGGDYIGNPPEINCVGKWDGNSWSMAGQIVGITVNKLLVYKGQLYAAGLFEIPHDNIVVYNGVGWDDLGGTTGEIVDLIEYDGELIACGNFDAAGTVSVENVAAWDGVNWSSLGGGLPITGTARIVSLATYNGLLYAGDEIGEIRQWNGSAWKTLGNANGSVLDMIEYDGFLYVGGFFTEINGTTYPHLAKWDGSWHNVGAGMNHDVLSLEKFQDDLYACGRFTSADNAAVNLICKSSPITGDQSIHPLRAGSLKIFPNPVTNGNFTVYVEEGYDELIILDMLGKVVNRSGCDKGSVTIDIPHFPRGIYCAMLSDRQGIQSPLTDLVIVR